MKWAWWVDGWFYLLLLLRQLVIWIARAAGWGILETQFTITQFIPESLGLPLHQLVKPVLSPLLFLNWWFDWCHARYMPWGSSECRSFRVLCTSASSGLPTVLQVSSALPWFDNRSSLTLPCWALLRWVSGRLGGWRVKSYWMQNWSPRAIFGLLDDHCTHFDPLPYGDSLVKMDIRIEMNMPSPGSALDSISSSLTFGVISFIDWERASCRCCVHELIDRLSYLSPMSTSIYTYIYTVNHFKPSKRHSSQQLLVFGCPFHPTFKYVCFSLQATSVSPARQSQNYSQPYEANMPRNSSSKID